MRGVRHLSLPFKNCAVSSVVEHYLDTVGVTGSNPVSRTISHKKMRKFLVSCALFFLVAPAAWALTPNIPAGILNPDLSVSTQFGRLDRVVRQGPTPVLHPALARLALSRRGSFIIEIDVATGLARDVRVFRSTGSAEVDDAIMRTLRHWRFRPRSVHKLTVPIRFDRSGRVRLGA